MALFVGLSCSDIYLFYGLNHMIRITHIFSNHQKACMQTRFVSRSGRFAQDVLVGQDTGDITHGLWASRVTVLHTAVIGAFAEQGQSFFEG